MHPVFVLGGLEIYAYALFTWLGAASACILALPGLKRAGMTAMQRWGVLILMCICFLVGARLWNVAVNPANYLGSFKWYTLKLAGLSLYGGLIGAVAALILFAKACRIRVLPIMDAMVVPGSAAFCIARIGCFLNGCCGGKATNSSFGVLFPDHNASEQTFSGMLSFLNNRPVHPTQLYELAGALIGIPLAILLAKKLRLREGARFLIYGAWFCLMRLAVLPFRSLGYGELVTKVIYPALYLLLAALCVVLLIAREQKKPAAEKDRGGPEE